jgi:hypothetical protein
VGETGDAHEHRRDRGACRGVGELAGPRSEDDLVGVAGLGREAALEQVGRALRVGVRQREVVRVPLADRLRHCEDADREDDPGDDDDPAVCDRPASQLQHGGAPIGRESSRLANLHEMQRDYSMTARNANSLAVQVFLYTDLR